MSRMVFIGGPLDGQEHEPQVGWPAPDAYQHRDFTGTYKRVNTYESEGSVRHVYVYEATTSSTGVTKT